MNSLIRNSVVWIATVIVCFLLYWTAARTNLHFMQPLLFLGYVALAAMAITALLCWEFVLAARQDDTRTKPQISQEN